MNRTILLAFAWAIAITGIAVAGRTDIISSSNAETLIIVMPALAITMIAALSKKSRCGARA